MENPRRPTSKFQREASFNATILEALFACRNYPECDFRSVPSLPLPNQRAISRVFTAEKDVSHSSTNVALITSAPTSPSLPPSLFSWRISKE